MHKLKKHQKTIGIILLIVISIVATGIFLYRHGKEINFEEKFNPTVDSISIVVPLPDAGTAEVLVRLTMHNPFPRELIIDSIQFTISYEKTEYIRGSISERKEIPSNETITTTLTGSADFVSYMDSVREIEDESIELEVNIRPFVKLPVLGTTEVSFNFTKKIELQKKPRVFIHRIDAFVNDFGRTYATMDILFEVNNFLPEEVVIRQLNYRVNHGGRTFISGKRDVPLHIHDDEHTSFRLPASVKVQDLNERISEIQQHDSMTIEIISEITVMDGDERKMVYLQIPQRIKVPNPVKVTIDQLDIEKLNFEEAEINLVLKVENHTDEDITINNYSYALKLDEEEWASEAVDRKVNIPANRFSLIEIPLTLSTIDFGKAAINHLLGIGDIDYVLDAHFNITTRDAILGNFLLNINAEGKVSAAGLDGE